MPIEICMESDGLHAYFDRRQVIRSRAAAGSAKPPTRKRSEKSALMASVWGKLWTPYLQTTADMYGSLGPLLGRVHALKSPKWPEVRHTRQDELASGHTGARARARREG